MKCSLGRIPINVFTEGGKNREGAGKGGIVCMKSFSLLKESVTSPVCVGLMSFHAGLCLWVPLIFLTKDILVLM